MRIGTIAISIRICLCRIYCHLLLFLFLRRLWPAVVIMCLISWEVVLTDVVVLVISVHCSLHHLPVVAHSPRNYHSVEDQGGSAFTPGFHV